MENLPETGGAANSLAAEMRADWIERFAFGAALLCLVHCLALPIALAALPALSRVLALPEDLHLWLLAFAVPASTLALASGGVGRKSLAPLALGSAGLLMLALGALVLGGSRGETPVTVAGSVLLATAHVLNWRRRHARHRHG